ncbi:helix-turn-helix domain-containing protein [Sphingobacterium sp. LRF_L2]|uniref:helix-turn-helix domain-containing protein n=1 Tax=Sphingobacterium sp. LRF_L2 TaxID=3369421 RepID=UPI003F5E36C2
MSKEEHLLSELWKSYPEAISQQSAKLKHFDMVEYLREILTFGPFYSYIIQVSDYSLHHVHENIFKIHNIASTPKNVKEIIHLIHPDDLDFVLEAERATLEIMQDIGFEHQLKLKSSYCFRMKVADHTYHLFHHQAAHLSKDDDQRVDFTLNIHTDIQHITAVNNKIVLVSGIGGRTDYCQIDLSKHVVAPEKTILSKREMDVLALLAKGLSSKQIGEKLFISELTVRVHRKKLLKKTNTNNSSNLVKRCIELGLL